MKRHFIITMIIFLALTHATLQRIFLRNEQPNDMKPDLEDKERKLLVVNHYEDRRKEYEAAKCNYLYTTI